jgi:hypothetical protein
VFRGVAVRYARSLPKSRVPLEPEANGIQSEWVCGIQYMPRVGLVVSSFCGDPTVPLVLSSDFAETCQNQIPSLHILAVKDSALDSVDERN